MKSAGPVKRVASVLETAGYIQLEQPQTIAGVPFEFDGLFVGPATLDLIAIFDLATETDEEQIRRRVEALARALDVVDSRRSMTVILVGPRPSQGLGRSLSEVGRVLAIGTPAEDDDASLRDSLAVLLPLELTVEEAGYDQATAWEVKQGELKKEHPAELTGLLDAAVRGESAVSDALRQLLESPLKTTGDES